MRKMRNFCIMRRLIRREDGQSIVEFAMVLPVLLLLLMGIIEFGRIISSYMIINNLAREGARFASVGKTDSQITTILLNEHATLDVDKLEVQYSPAYSARVKGEPLKVTVNYTVDLITPLIPEFLPNPLPISSECTMRLE
ncbi:MAG: TadE family protein [Syntrophomonadaceae bacterium]